MATSECVPAGSEAVVKVAVPFPARVAVPTLLLPSMSVMVPVGIATKALVTAPRRLTGSAGRAGLLPEVMTTVERSRTDCVSAAEVLVRLLLSPA